MTACLADSRRCGEELDRNLEHRVISVSERIEGKTLSGLTSTGSRPPGRIPALRRAVCHPWPRMLIGAHVEFR